MVILKKPTIAKAVVKDGFEQFKEAGRDILTGLDQRTASSDKPKDGKEKSWEDEWLKNKDKKDKPPVSDKVGEHSKIDPAKTFGEHDKRSEEAARSRIASMLNSRFTQASQTSEHGRAEAQKKQEENKPIYDKLWEEKEQEKKRREDQAAKQQGSVASPQGKTGRGTALVGKKKRQPSPMELNRAEFRGAKGK